MAIDPNTYWTPKQIEATAKYARLRTFKTESEARDFVFRSLERTDATFGALSGVNGPAVNRAVADRVPLYTSGKSYKIGKRIRDKPLDWSAVDVREQSLAPLREIGLINPFDGYRVIGLRTFKVGDVHETERHAYTDRGRGKTAAYAARIKDDRTFVMPVVNQHGVVLDGHHRLVAVRDVLKWKTIPCMVVHVNDGSEDETAAQFSQPVLAYHGTSAAFARDILKHGMQPTRTTVGRWAGAASDPDASQYARSRASYGGVYWTPNLLTARSAATNLLIKGAGSWAAVRDNVLIVCALVQPQGAVGDEDNFGVRLELPEALYPYLIIAERMGLRSAAADTVRQFNTEVVRWVESHVGDNAALRRDLHAVKSLAREVFLTEVERRAAYAPDEWRRSCLRALSRLALNRDTPTALPRALVPPHRGAAEARARRALDLFIHKVRGSVKRGTDARDPWTNFRTTTPVTYRGQNRIVCVVELNKTGEAVVRYGQLPDDFREQYRQRVGDLRVVDRFSTVETAVLTIETTPPRNNPQTAFSYGGVHYDQRDGLGSVPNNASVDYMGMAVVITPRQFLRLAYDLDVERDGHVPFITEHMRQGGAIGCPFLKFDFDQFKVIDHEGRHRCRAIAALHSTMADIVVHVFPSGGKRARSITQGMIDRFASGDVRNEQGQNWSGGRLFETYWHAGAWHTIKRG